MYKKDAPLVFLLHYKHVIPDWMPQSHRQLFEDIILKGFKYSLDQVVALNVEEVIQNPEITFLNPPQFIFYMQDNIPKNIEQWLNVQGVSKERIECIPSLLQMVESIDFKRKAWKTIQNFLKVRDKFNTK
ncbi:MAG: hypothetical protein NZ455_09765 [Bacteroidia bacterium]|nr:hypothetical protein [Bacteroidia bacterium]MDW8347555.1 hypothetical protein [Bacteroidia bacterium]